MNGLLQEIMEIPERARICYAENKNVKLPYGVPYLGMGASYYAALTLWYLGKSLYPYLASEYYLYQGQRTQKLGVLISQSGESSEVLWNTERFGKFIAVTNNPNALLTKARSCKRVIKLHAEAERFVSTKTYINTLVVLYTGLHINPVQAIETMAEQFVTYRERSDALAQEISEYMDKHAVKGLFVLGSGPNTATAKQGALTLSEYTKYGWQGLSVAQYDHGPKETAQDSIVLFLQSNGKDAGRIEHVRGVLKKKSNAFVREISVEQLPEELSPFCHIAQLNLLMVSLAEKRGQEETFLGEKITRF